MKKLIIDYDAEFVLSRSSVTTPHIQHLTHEDYFLFRCDMYIQGVPKNELIVGGDGNHRGETKSQN